MSQQYEHLRDGIYRLKRERNPITKDAYYLHWDHLHGDVEVYSNNEKHVGSLDPEKLMLYKGPVFGRPFPLQ